MELPGATVARIAPHAADRAGAAEQAAGADRDLAVTVPLAKSAP